MAFSSQMANAWWGVPLKFRWDKTRRRIAWRVLEITGVYLSVKEGGFHVLPPINILSKSVLPTLCAYLRYIHVYMPVKIRCTYVAEIASTIQSIGLVR